MSDVNNVISQARELTELYASSHKDFAQRALDLTPTLIVALVQTEQARALLEAELGGLKAQLERLIGMMSVDQLAELLELETLE